MAFKLNYTFKDNAYVELYKGTAKFWLGEGLPTYEGGLEGFDMLYPKHMRELLDAGIIIKEE